MVIGTSSTGREVAAVSPRSTAILLALLLAACHSVAPPPIPPTSQQIEQETSARLDADKNLWSYESPAYSGAQLRASREQKTGMMSWQLHLTVQSDDWPVLDRAYLLGGTPLEVV